ALRLEIDRLGIEQRAADGDDDHRAAPHVRSLLVPQRELAGELRVLIDPRLHLERSVDELGLREIEDQRGAVMPTVAASGDPANQVVTVRRRERQDLDELD